MISFNGLKFAKTGKEVVETLFSGPRTAHGFYKVFAGGVMLCDLQRNPRAFVKKEGRTAFIVSCRKEGAATRYLFSTMSIDETWLHLDGLTFSQNRAECEKLIEEAYHV